PLASLALGVDDLRIAAPVAPLQIDGGETQLGHRRGTQPRERLLDRDLAGAKLFEQRPRLVGCHRSFPATGPLHRRRAIAMIRVSAGLVYRLCPAFPRL